MTLNAGRPTLRAHRLAIAQNANAYIADLPRVHLTAVAHLKRSGFVAVTYPRCSALINDFVKLIFETQDCHPSFHTESPLPFCWNSPKDWDKNYTRYEWGHLRSRNQNADAASIENLCLQSARCNQHVQTSMDIEEVEAWLAGSATAARIGQIMERRQTLFKSNQWKNLCDSFYQFR